MTRQHKSKAPSRVALCVFAALVIVASCVTYKTVIKALHPIKYSESVTKYSEEYGVDESLIYAVICTESSFDPNARSDVGALGLMQIMPDTLDWICMKTGDTVDFEELSDPDTGIRCGTFLLKMLLDEFENEQTALAAYHAGRGRTSEWLHDTQLSKDGVTLDKIPYRDTSHYVSKVTKAKSIYERLYEMPPLEK